MGMDVAKIKKGQKVNYRLRAKSGTGVVKQVVKTKIGSHFVHVVDEATKEVVKPRPSQIDVVAS